jgi:hypothetical protein
MSLRKKKKVEELQSEVQIDTFSPEVLPEAKPRATKRASSKGYNWEAVVALVASGKTLTEAAKAMGIPRGTVLCAFSEHPEWPRPSHETIQKGRAETRTENFLKSQSPDFVATIQNRMKEKAAVLCEIAGNKLVQIADFTSAQSVTNRKEAMQDALIIKTTAQAAEVVMGLKKDQTIQSNVLVNLSLSDPDSAIGI